MQSEPREDDGSQEPGDVDSRVAVGIRALREKSGMSQADLAGRMAAAGWRWHPQTIHRIESGQRKVTVGEAEALARILGTSLTRLTWPDPASSVVNFLSTFTGRADSAFERIASATGELLFARDHLGRGIAEARKRGIDGQEHVREALAGAEAALEHATPERAVETGREDYARDYPGDDR